MLQLPPKETRVRKDGHTVLAIGYDKYKKICPWDTVSGMVLCQNSWGDSRIRRLEFYRWTFLVALQLDLGLGGDRRLLDGSRMLTPVSAGAKSS